MNRGVKSPRTKTARDRLSLGAARFLSVAGAKQTATDAASASVANPAPAGIAAPVFGGLVETTIDSIVLAQIFRRQCPLPGIGQVLSTRGQFDTSGPFLGLTFEL